MPDAFYLPDGEGRYLATELTRGPWDPDSQHAGPPSALLGRELERLPDADGFQLGRVTFEILGPVAIGPALLSARILRPGRRVQLVEVELSDGDRALMRATAWRLRRDHVELPERVIARTPPPPGPERGREVTYFTSQEQGYHTAMEVRFVSGGFMEEGPATAWLRMRRRLVGGEEPSALQRLLVVADVGNGISSPVDYRKFLFLNVELSVHIEQLPVGEWIGVDATTFPRPTGVGVTDSVLFDREGRVGRAAQTLLVSGR